MEPAPCSRPLLGRLMRRCAIVGRPEEFHAKDRATPAFALLVCVAFAIQQAAITPAGDAYRFKCWPAAKSPGGAYGMVVFPRIRRLAECAGGACVLRHRSRAGGQTLPCRPDASRHQVDKANQIKYSDRKPFTGDTGTCESAMTVAMLETDPLGLSVPDPKPEYPIYEQTASYQGMPWTKGRFRRGRTGPVVRRQRLRGIFD